MEYYIDPVVFIVGKTGGENRAVRNLLDLFAEGATIPFIARYRKEKTGNMVSLFSYQGCLSCDSLFTLPHLFFFVKNFFQVFSKFFELFRISELFF